MKRLAGKVAIVTGAGRGIGRGIALAFGEEGASVVVASRTERTVNEVANEIVSAGGDAIGITCDVGRRDQVFALIEATVERYGTIDVLVNNAQGFGPESNPAGAPVLTPLEDFDEEEWDYTFRTGLMGTLWTMKAAFPYLKKHGGKVINFGSWAGITATWGMAAYSANKEGIRSLSRTAAREWGQYKINVNVINPGIESDALAATWSQRSPEVNAAALAKLPLGEFGKPKDAANLAVFLACHESDFITGVTIAVDSGVSI